jgi:hypothetical protein
VTWKRAVLTLSAICLALTTATQCSDDKSTGSSGPEPFYPTDFRASYVQVRDCRFSSAHDGHNILVFADPENAGAYVDGAYPLPVGSVLVKVLHTDPGCSEIAGFVSMRKGGAQTAPLSADWSWQELDSRRKVMREGQLPSCIGCHTGCTEGRDFTCADP